jgi:hypothetical protein
VPRSLLAAIRTWPEDGRLRWWVWHEARKLLAIFRDHEYANNVNFYFFRRATPLLAFLPTFGMIVGLGFVGIALLVHRGRDRTAGLLLALAAGGLVGIMLLALAVGRYRLPLAMLTTIPAGVTLAALLRWYLAKQWRPILMCIVPAVALSAVSFRAVPTRVLFDPAMQPHFIRGADARLYEDLSALRSGEFAEEARLLTERGDVDAARSLFTGYLAELRQRIAETPAPQDINTRRRIVNQAYLQLVWARDLFSTVGLDDLVASIDAEIEWIRTTQRRGRRRRAATCWSTATPSSSRSLDWKTPRARARRAISSSAAPPAVAGS